VLVVAGALSGTEAARQCRRLVRLLDGHPGVVVCDVGAIGRADAAAVDGLARMQLAARRRGHNILLRGPSDELRRLIALFGLDEALPCTELDGRAGGQTEQREQRVRVQEGREPHHPTI
jgi:ABC-type transporter Mla MlaB component